MTCKSCGLEKQPLEKVPPDWQVSMHFREVKGNLKEIAKELGDWQSTPKRAFPKAYLASKKWGRRMISQFHQEEMRIYKIMDKEGDTRNL